MSAKHTPGPWVFRRRRDGVREVAGPDYNLARVHGPLTVGDETGVGYSGADANARLIAAAPELLEAAQTLLGCIMDEHGTIPSYSPLGRLLNHDDDRVSDAAADAVREGGSADLLPVHPEYDPENWDAIQKLRAAIAKAVNTEGPGRWGNPSDR